LNFEAKQAVSRCLVDMMTALYLSRAEFWCGFAGPQNAPVPPLDRCHDKPRRVVVELFGATVEMYWQLEIGLESNALVILFKVTMSCGEQKIRPTGGLIGRDFDSRRINSS